MLDRLGGKAEKWFRTIFFIPCVISVVVISKKCGCPCWTLPSAPSTKCSIPWDSASLSTLGWGDSSTALISMLFILIWAGFGWGLLFYYAGLKGIPDDLYEAASLDGASGFRLHWRITVPLLSPVITVQITLAMITALKQMETVFLTTNGGPGDSTQFLAVYLYNKAFSASQYGYANAISILFIIVCLLATYLSNKLTRSDATEF
ncbi:carbohydrate ABC transporter permease [Paenibacillus rhizoplanae]